MLECLNLHTCFSDMYVRRPLHPMLFNASKGWAVSNGEGHQRRRLSFWWHPGGTLLRVWASTLKRDTLWFPMTARQITLI